MTEPSTSSGPAALLNDRLADLQARDESAAQQIADRWNVLAADERADLVAAYAERQHLMDERGVTAFRACTRTWTTERSPLHAEDVRAETEYLRSVLASTPPV